MLVGFYWDFEYLFNKRNNKFMSVIHKLPSILPKYVSPIPQNTYISWSLKGTVNYYERRDAIHDRAYMECDVYKYEITGNNSTSKNDDN